jgi:cytochrome c biogenesis protein CcmG, thiol:disulfide interchange protein DsbE
MTENSSGEGARTWGDAFRDVLRSAGRHRVRTTVIGVCVAASLAAIGVAGTESGGTATASTPAPQFSVRVLGGRPDQLLALSQYPGRPLIVNFFASWCHPCQQETPLLASWYRAERGKLPLVGIDENDALASALSFTSKHGVSYPVGFDPSVSAGSQFGVNTIPSTFFLDASHHIVKAVYGALTQASLNQGIALATGKGS